MKNFIYLVQGQSDLVSSYLHLADRENADALFLTYDKPIDDAIFFPNSTWAQGRNKLLERALIKGDYTYYIFCDDDIAFVKGGWDTFEANLMALKPPIMVPVVPETKSHFQWLRYQLLTQNDTQLMAFHRDVVMDGIVLPYQEQFDDIHWWATCEIQETLIQNFYQHSSIQVNDIEISNECHDRYPNTKSRQNIFKERVRDWLLKQFRNEYNIRKLNKDHCLSSLYRTILFMLYRRFSSRPLNYSVTESKCRELLTDDSEISKRYFARRDC